MRVLTTEVWYPQGSSVARPLVVFAHGYRVGVAPYRRFCRALVERGFVVAAPTFPLSDQGVAGPLLDEADVVNEPADVSFVITQLLAASGRKAEPLAGRINPAQIAVVGHSDGATVAAALGYLPSVRDARIRLVVADAPSALPLPVGTQPQRSTTPLLLIHGDRDSVAPISGTQRLMTQVRTPGWFLLLRRANHLDPIQGPSPWTAVFDRVASDFIRGTFTAQPNLEDELNRDVAASPAFLIRLQAGT